MNMELARKIYKAFVEDHGLYDAVEINTRIIKLEYDLKKSLSDANTLLYQMILANKKEVHEMEILHLINFVLENYAEVFVNKNIDY